MLLSVLSLLNTLQALQDYILSFNRGHDNAFMSIQKHEDWWKWAQTSLLNILYKNASATTEVSYKSSSLNEGFKNTIKYGRFYELLK